MSKPVLWIVIPCYNEEQVPVSYTHLDVYKRQLLLRLQRFVQRNGLCGK